MSEICKNCGKEYDPELGDIIAEGLCVKCWAQKTTIICHKLTTRWTPEQREAYK